MYLKTNAKNGKNIRWKNFCYHQVERAITLWRGIEGNKQIDSVPISFSPTITLKDILAKPLLTKPRNTDTQYLFHGHIPMHDYWFKII